MFDGFCKRGEHLLSEFAGVINLAAPAILAESVASLVVEVGASAVIAASLDSHNHNFTHRVVKGILFG